MRKMLKHRIHKYRGFILNIAVMLKIQKWQYRLCLKAEMLPHVAIQNFPVIIHRAQDNSRTTEYSDQLWYTYVWPL